MKSKLKAQLKLNLGRYDAKIVRGKFISITHENYMKIQSSDKRTLKLINELKYNIQLKCQLEE